MSAIFGETLTFGQENGPDIRLRVTGDEFYAVYETLDGYSAVHDADRGQFCYAQLVDGSFVSSGVAVTSAPPAGTRKHLREAAAVRHERFAARRGRLHARSARDAMLTFGPSQGLLPGRRLSSGTVRGLTILVEFQDIRTSVTTADLDALLNGDNYRRNGNFCSAREYFRIVSSGRLDYRNDVVGPFRLSQKRSFYVTQLLVKEALDLAVASGVDLRRYDSRSEGIVDALNILYAGQTQYSGQLWPHNSSLGLRYGTMNTDLYLLTSAGRTADDLSIGTFCHENGHLLCRFPDMYDYGDSQREGDAGKSAGIGSYCLMGSGNHLDFGRTPSPVCAYLRDLAGWCDTVIDLNQATQAEAEHGRYDQLLKFRGATPNEYFLVENRSKIGLDAALTSSGLAVYHCDTMGSNEFQAGTAQRHYQCALLQADGRSDLEGNVNQGDGGDLFAAVAGVAVSAATTPSSRLWSGADSGLVLADIGVPDTKIGFRLGSGPTPPTGTRFENSEPAAIPDDQPGGIRSTIPVTAAGLAARLKVAFDITHTYIGDLVVALQRPGGASVVLHNGTGGGTHDLAGRFDSAAVPALASLLEQPVAGDWVLAVRDTAAVDVGTLDRWSLEFTLAADTGKVSAQAQPDAAIPDNQRAGISSGLAIERSGNVGRIAVQVDITHTYIGDLRVELVAPSGRAVVLHGQLGRDQDNLVASYDSAAPLSPLAALVGQPMQGEWTLRVADLAAVDVGRLNRWSIELTPA